MSRGYEHSILVKSITKVPVGGSSSKTQEYMADLCIYCGQCKMNWIPFLRIRISYFQRLNYNECLQRSLSQIRQESQSQRSILTTSYTVGMCLRLRTNKWTVRILLAIVQVELNTTWWQWYSQHLSYNVMFQPFIWKQTMVLPVEQIS